MRDPRPGLPQDVVEQTGKEEEVKFKRSIVRDMDKSQYIRCELYGDSKRGFVGHTGDDEKYEDVCAKVIYLDNTLNKYILTDITPVGLNHEPRVFSTVEEAQAAFEEEKETPLETNG